MRESAQRRNVRRHRNQRTRLYVFCAVRCYRFVIIRAGNTRSKPKPRGIGQTNACAVFHIEPYAPALLRIYTQIGDVFSAAFIAFDTRQRRFKFEAVEIQTHVRHIISELIVIVMRSVSISVELILACIRTARNILEIKTVMGRIVQRYVICAILHQGKIVTIRNNSIISPTVLIFAARRPPNTVASRTVFYFTRRKFNGKILTVGDGRIVM